MSKESEKLLTEIRQRHYNYGVVDTLRKIEKLLGEDVCECENCGDYVLASNVFHTESGILCNEKCEKQS